MNIKLICLVVAAVIFGVEAVWHKNIIAAGLCFFVVAFLV